MVFKYLGSMFAAEGGSETDVNNRVKVAWDKWREVSLKTHQKCQREPHRSHRVNFI